MTFKEALKKERRWHKRALIINLFHNRRLLKNRKWTMRNTAKRIGISHGAVSEAINLAKLIIDMPDLEKGTRADALKFMRQSE